MEPVAIWVDAFTERPFAGNPAVVCLLDAPRGEGWMQDLAREMGVSETAFVSPRPSGDGYDLRWFTPAAEVNLCGHATLASAHALWQEGRLAPDEQARFHTRSGLLTATRRDPWIELDFPASPLAAVPSPAWLPAALGAEPRWTGQGTIDWLVELADERTVRELTPDTNAFPEDQQRGVCVTARADGTDYDFVSRYFAPSVGIDEDPVTGSTHTMLAPYWCGKLGREELVGFQASARGGMVRVRALGDRVALGGRAVTVLRGTLHIEEES